MGRNSTPPSPRRLTSSFFAVTSHPTIEIKYRNYSGHGYIVIDTPDLRELVRLRMRPILDAVVAFVDENMMNGNGGNDAGYKTYSDGT